MTTLKYPAARQGPALPKNGQLVGPQDCVTATEAALYLGVTFDQFRFAVYSFVKGFLRKGYMSSKTAWTTRERKGRGKGQRDERGHVIDVVGERNKLAWMPTPVQGTAQSKKALYLSADILRLDEMAYFKKRDLTMRASSVLHLALEQAAQAKSAADRIAATRAEAKATGVCYYKRCGLPVFPKSNLCPEHREQKRLRERGELKVAEQSP